MNHLILGIAFAIAFIWPIAGLNHRTKARLNHYAFWLDIGVGVIMSALFLGTQGGMIIATIATVLFTAWLHLWSIPQHGKEHLTFRGWQRTQ